MSTKSTLNNSQLTLIVDSTYNQTTNELLSSSGQHQNLINTLKLRGILDGFKLDYELKPSTSHKVSEPTPILVSQSGQSVAIFWNCIFFLDKTYWNCALQFSDARHKEELFTLFEECDFKLFPTLFAAYLRSKRSNFDQYNSSYKFTKTLQWPLLSKLTRKVYATTYRAKSFSTFLETKPTAPDYTECNSSAEITKVKNRLDSILNNNTLPELHNNILNFAVNSVLTAVK